LREATVDRGAVFYAADYKGMDQEGSRRRGKSAGDILQLAQVVQEG